MYNQLEKHFMTGVSWFLPVIVSSAILMGLIQLSQYLPLNTMFVDGLLNELYVLVFNLMFPILGAYIVQSIAPRNGMLVGMLVGYYVSVTNLGFVILIIIAMISGYLLVWLKKMLDGIHFTKGNLVQIFLSLVVVFLLLTLFNEGLSTINGLYVALFSKNNLWFNMILSGLVGWMIAYDIGGPVNKIGYLFSVSLLFGLQADEFIPSTIMAACACAGMTISSGCALATTLFPDLFSKKIQKEKASTWIMGLTFIAEGAIPYVFEYKKIAHPAILIGSSLTAMLVAAFGLTITAPIGGIFTIILVNNKFMYIMLYLFGTILVAVLFKVFSMIEIRKLREGSHVKTI